MSEDLIAKVIKKVRRVTLIEIAEANLEMFERMGLGLDDLERMATVAHLDVEDLLLLPTGACRSTRPRHIIGRPGRKNTTEDIAAFAAVRRRNKMTWRERHNHSDDDRVKNTETIREAYRRHYGDKAGKKY